MNERQFIELISSQAMKIHKEKGILASVVISQACLESGFGKYHISNNLFGIKKGNWKGKTVFRKTKEYVNGKVIEVNAEFRAYSSFADSIEDYSNLILSLSRYKGIVNDIDYKSVARKLYQAGYATDPKYPQKIISIIEKYKLDKFDIVVPVNKSITIVYKDNPYYIEGYFLSNKHYIPIGFLWKLGIEVVFDSSINTIFLSPVK